MDEKYVELAKALKAAQMKLTSARENERHARFLCDEATTAVTDAADAFEKYNVELFDKVTG